VTESLNPALDRAIDEHAFSGVVRVAARGDIVYERAVGFARRATKEPNEFATQFALASGTKTFTAVTVMSLIADGVLAPSTTARSVLGSTLPLVPDDVTVEQLLAHRSGIGDYVDEEGDDDRETWPLSVPATALRATSDYVAVLDGHPPKFPAGERFAYCNSGYVVLALLIEAATNASFYDQVDARVFTPAGMTASGFFTFDALPDGAALGYLDENHGSITNENNIPWRGSGDGGAFSTLDDIEAFWEFALSLEYMPEMLRARSERYGLGFWLRPDGAPEMEGCDAGVSFRSMCDEERGIRATVMSNSTLGAWPIARVFEEWWERLS
jgi:CubicO group peptidase (beta-lactamase class C family)